MTKKNIDLYNANDLKYLVDQFMESNDIETAERLRLILVNILDSIIERKKEKDR